MNTQIVENFFIVDMSELRMPIITVYEKPTDYPNQFVARLWDVDKPTNVIMLADSLEVLRNGKPEHMTIMASAKQDDPVIVETWL